MLELSLRLPLFVYGTLLPGERNHHRFLAGRTLTETPATVLGELWWIADEDYPYLCCGNELIHGCLTVIDAVLYSTTLRAIDRLEDFYPDNPDACLYLRRPIEVVAPFRGQRAWTYLWHAQDRPGVKLVSGNFSARKHTSEG